MPRVLRESKYSKTQQQVQGTFLHGLTGIPVALSAGRLGLIFPVRTGVASNL